MLIFGAAASSMSRRSNAQVCEWDHFLPPGARFRSQIPDAVGFLQSVGQGVTPSTEVSRD